MNSKDKENHSHTRKYRRWGRIDEDYLAKLSDEDLKNIFLDVRSIINKNRRNKKHTKNKELEMCYIQRELQNRKRFR
jgi:hypothetical protein